MNREIKFRGKRIDTGVWVYGSLQQYDYGNCCIVAFVDHHEQWYDVIPDTIGQFTGLYDNNGDEIYEKDILVSKCLDVAIGYLEVLWSDDKAAFLVEDYNEDRQSIGYLDYLSVYDTKAYTVCGNVHDNPELLEI